MSEVRAGSSRFELLPCPFCGGEAKAYQHGDVGFVIQCRRCGVLSYVTKDYAIAGCDGLRDRLRELGIEVDA